jgi:hypothetical protein
VSGSTIPTRSRRRAERLRESVPRTAPNAAADEGAGESSANVVGVRSETGSERQPSVTPSSGFGSVADLARLPIVAHPLRLFLVARGVSLDRAARAFGISTRTLRDWITWRAAPPTWRARSVVVDLLGRDADPDELFPPNR